MIVFRPHGRHNLCVWKCTSMCVKKKLLGEIWGLVCVNYYIKMSIFELNSTFAIANCFPYRSTIVAVFLWVLWTTSNAIYVWDCVSGCISVSQFEFVCVHACMNIYEANTVFLFRLLARLRAKTASFLMAWIFFHLLCYPLFYCFILSNFFIWHSVTLWLRTINILFIICITYLNVFWSLVEILNKNS